MSGPTSTVLIGLLLCAVATDLHRRKIPNALIVLGLFAGLAFATLDGGLRGTLQGLLGAVVGLGMLFPFFALRLVGAGDAKLLAVIGSFVGPASVLWVTLYTFIAGGILAVVVLSASRRGRESLANLKLMLTSVLLLRHGAAETIGHVGANSAARVPYAVALASGAAFWMVSKS